MTTITMTINLINQKSLSDSTNRTSLTRERLRKFLGIYLSLMQLNRSSNKLLLKRHLFRKRTQASKYNQVKDNLKQNDLLIHVDYSENYNNKQQWEIQSAYFGHVGFSVFTACCYFKDESNAINKDAITVTTETSDHSRSVCIVSAKSYLFRERNVHPSSTEIECNCLE